MTPEQEAHLQHIKETFAADVDKKYRKGQAEHGGDLFRKCDVKLVEDALEEVMDAVVYLRTALDNLRAAKQIKAA